MNVFFSRIPPAFWGFLLVMLPLVAKAVDAYLSLPLAEGAILSQPDPDSWLRLTLVRDWLAGGDWHSHAVPRSDAPFGTTVSPWTRPLDMVIALLVALQFAGGELAARLVNASLVLPVLWMGLFLLGIFRLLRFVGATPAAAFTANVLVATSLLFLAYFSTGNADHHGLLLALFVWAMGGVLHPNPSPRLTSASGLLFALMLWTSPEALALIGAAFGWYACCWLAGDTACARPFPRFAASIALALLTAMLVERPAAQWLVPVYDAISIVYVVLFLAIAAATALLYRFTPRRFLARVLAGGAAVASVGGLMYYCYPLFFRGTMAEVDPYILTTFLPRIREAQSILSEPPLYVAAALMHGAMALLLLGIAWWRKDAFLSRTHALQLGYFIAATLLLNVVQQRFYGYFCAMTTVALAAFCGALLNPEHTAVAGSWPARALARHSPQGQALRRVPLLLAIFMLPVGLALTFAATATESESETASDSCLRTAQQLIQGDGLTDALGKEPIILFTTPDLGTQVLFFTPYRIIASNYHREGAGIRYLWEADDITAPHELRRYLAVRKVDALMLCPMGYAPEGSLLQAIRRGEVRLPWLRPVPYPLPPRATPELDDAPSAPALFRVIAASH